MIKRIYILSFCIVSILIALLPINKASAIDSFRTSISVIEASTTLPLESTFSINISVQDVSSLYGFAGDFSYDDSLLEIVDTDDEICSGQNNFSCLLGTRLVLIKRTSKSGDFDIARISFKMKSTFNRGSTSIILSNIDDAKCGDDDYATGTGSSITIHAYNPDQTDTDTETLPIIDDSSDDNSNDNDSDSYQPSDPGESITKPVDSNNQPSNPSESIIRSADSNNQSSNPSESIIRSVDSNNQLSNSSEPTTKPVDGNKAGPRIEIDDGELEKETGSNKWIIYSVSIIVLISIAIAIFFRLARKH